MPNANVSLEIGSARTVNDHTNPLTVGQKQLLHYFAVNTFSVVAAAELAVKRFAILPHIASKTFIVTGNYLDETPRTQVVGYSMTEAATTNLIHAASEAYEGKGYK